MQLDLQTKAEVLKTIKPVVKDGQLLIRLIEQGTLTRDKFTEVMRDMQSHMDMLWVEVETLQYQKDAEGLQE